VSFAGVLQRPRPVQRPHPPIVVGGWTPAALRRAVQVGNGWYGWQMGLGQTAETLRALRKATARRPRPAALGELEITITPPGTVDIDTCRRYRDLGVHGLALLPSTTDGTAIDDLIQTVGATLVPRI